MDKIKVFLIDDHRIVRDGIRSLLMTDDSIDVCGEFDSYYHSVEYISRLQPDIIIMDISMPEISGIDATAEISKEFPNVKVLILSMYTNEEFVIKSIASGAKGYLPKNTSKKELLSAIYDINEGKEYFSPEISKIIVKSMMNKAGKQEISPLNLLTRREEELLKLVAEGFSNTEIAEKLFISVRTVETHKNHIMTKLDLKNTVELIKFAIKEGITEL